ncbi:hypothetical protein FKW77_006865 [Venturia effusa]|uniref:Uncharacterized protein n=1 Tax=Venturia effusa TaxID=50376 RepID=A0A517LLQ1_9PEZI|nr:hypothetical protein FKW77_006865 [Venturia effusa]
MAARTLSLPWMVLWLLYSTLAETHKVPRLVERSVDPESASLALFAALPTSLAAIAITNPAAAATIIQGEFATGTPTWFTNLPTDVQTYYLTAAGAAILTSNGIGISSTAKASTRSSIATVTTSRPTTSAAITRSTMLGFWFFFRKRKKNSLEDLAESHGVVDRDGDLPELIGKHPVVVTQAATNRGHRYDASLLSSKTAVGTASRTTQPKSGAYQEIPERVHELDSLQANPRHPELKLPVSRHDTNVSNDGRSLSVQDRGVPVASPGSYGVSAEDVARLETEYTSVRERRIRLLEINRLDEEERNLKQRIEKTVKPAGAGSSMSPT